VHKGWTRNGAVRVLAAGRDPIADLAESVPAVSDRGTVIGPDAPICGSIPQAAQWTKVRQRESRSPVVVGSVAALVAVVVPHAFAAAELVVFCFLEPAREAAHRLRVRDALENP
jgi:hypothetical protein